MPVDVGMVVVLLISMFMLLLLFCCHCFFLLKRGRSVMLSHDRSDIVEDYIFCASFFYSFTASDGSEGITAGRVVSHRSSIPSLLLMVQRESLQAVWYHIALSWRTMV